jgi:hypothetical protein
MLYLLATHICSFVTIYKRYSSKKDRQLLRVLHGFIVVVVNDLFVFGVPPDYRSGKLKLDIIVDVEGILRSLSHPVSGLLIPLVTVYHLVIVIWRWIADSLIRHGFTSLWKY